MEHHLATVWESVADVTGDCPAFVQGEVRRSWSEFDERASRLAAAFLGAGLGPGSKVALYLYNAPEYMEAYYAALKIRAVPVNVNYRYLDEELLYLLENSEAQALVFHTELGERVERIRDRATGVRLLAAVDDGTGSAGEAEGYEALLAAHDPAPRITRSPDDIAMTYTGGTTGMPKGVMARMGAAVQSMLVTVPPSLGLEPLSDPTEIAGVARDRAESGEQWASLPACPLMHGTGMGIGTTPAVTYGGRIVFLPSRKLDPTQLWDVVQEEKVNGIAIVGDAFARPMLRALEQGGSWDLSALKLLLSAGAMFSYEVRESLLEYMPTTAIVDYIAATEGFMGTAISVRGAVVPTGRFNPGPQVKVLDDDGRPVAPGSGKRGVLVAGGEVPAGYYKDEEKTARTFKEIDGERVSIPGDYATVEADGSITLLGRGSQCINTGGEKVFAEEVEEVVKRHVDVDDCLVFGVDDERFGQRVVGVVSIASGASASPVDIIEQTQSQLASYKVPRALTVVDVVPRAPNGKADYKRARALHESRARAAGSPHG